MEEIKDCLLTELLGCGYGDLERLLQLFYVAHVLKIDYREVFDYVNEADIYHSLMYNLMDMIVNKLVEEGIEIDTDSFNPFLNYLDSWFNIGFLDEVIWYFDGVEKEELLEEIKSAMGDEK